MSAKSKKQTTDNLIQSLSQEDCKVPFVCCPFSATLIFMAVAVPVIVIALHYFGIRPDLLDKMTDWHFVSQVFFGVGTGVTATMAAFALAIPGFSRQIAFIPFVFFILWVATLGYGIWEDYQAGKLEYYHNPICVHHMIKYGLPLAILMIVVMRNFAPINPRTSAALAGLAVSSLCAGSWIIHDNVDPSLVQLVWHLGMVVAFTAVFYVAGRFLLRWR